MIALPYTPVCRSALGPAITAYISLQRSLGRKFRNEAYVLADLDRFLAALGAEAMTADRFAAWALTLARLKPQVRRQHMLIVRKLALYLRRTDPCCFVPDPQQFPARSPAQPPFIFEEQQILALLDQAAHMTVTARSPLRAAVYRLAVVLLYTAGLRRGELVRLRVGDYDRTRRTLLVRASKFHKSRLVALSDDATHELDSYLDQRTRFPHTSDSPLLAHGPQAKQCYAGCTLRVGFQTLCRAAGVYTASGRPPRVHDVRHTHAAHVLLRCYRADANPQTVLPALATSMGHVSIVSTAYYLTLIEPALEAAADRVARRIRPILETAAGGNRA